MSLSAQSRYQDNCGDLGSFIIACALRSIWHDVMLSFRLTPVSLAAPGHSQLMPGLVEPRGVHVHISTLARDWCCLLQLHKLDFRNIPKNAGSLRLVALQQLRRLGKPKLWQVLGFSRYNLRIKKCYEDYSIVW